MKHLALLALVLVPAAGHTDNVVFSPAACHANVDDSYETLGVGATRGGAWFNHYGPWFELWSTTAKTMSCPATRGDDGSTTGIYGATLDVEHPSAKVTCVLRVGAYFTSTRTTPGPGRHTLVWDALGRYLPTDPVTIRCSMPASGAAGTGKIHGYTVDSP